VTQPTIVASQQLPVVTQDDVASEWSDDVFDASNPPPIVSAIQAGQTAMLLAYQRASAYAAAQSDPARATGEYEDECGWEREVNRQANESDGNYRARLFHQTVVDPVDIIAAANRVLAPFTATSCVYFEHSDCWFAREDYQDVVFASNTTPIEIRTRYGLPSFMKNGSQVTVTGVTGNTAANGTYVAQIVMGDVVAFSPFHDPIPTVTITGTPTSAVKIQITILNTAGVGGAFFELEIDGIVQPSGILTNSSVLLGNTGLSANFATGTYSTFTTYTVAPRGFTLTGTVGNGAYTGNGSVLVLGLVEGWSSHVFGTPYNTQNYPDRHYSNLPHRFSCGARAFNDAYGRIFWLVAPDISGVDSSVTPGYTGYLDVVGATNTSPIQITTRFPLPLGLATAASVTVAGVTGNTGANGTFSIIVTGANAFTLTGSTGTGTFTGGGSVQPYLPATYPSDGFFVGGAFNLPGQLLVNHSATGTLDASHTKALVQSSTGTTTVQLPASGSAGEMVAVFDVDKKSSANPITVSGNGHNLEDPSLPGTHSASITIRTNGLGVFWVWNTGSSQWDLTGRNGAFLWAIGGTVDSIYSQLVSAVDAIRGQGIRWGFLADPKLGN